MKTNQLMIRDYEVIQRTSDSYFNATSVITWWNKNNPQKKLMAEYLRIKSTAQFTEHIQKSKGIKFPILVSKKGTWMHPYIFIDFCMWVSVEFKSQAIQWVLDGLIKSRHDAGDYYNEMCATIMRKHIDTFGTKPPAMLYMNEARLIKKITGIRADRNQLTEKQLNTITILQKINATMIEDGIGRASRMRQLRLINRGLNAQISK